MGGGADGGVCCLGWLFPHLSCSPSLISSGSFCWHLSSREAFGAGPSGRQRVRRGDFGASGVLLGSESACSWSRGCMDGSGLGGARTERSGRQLRRAVGTEETYSHLLSVIARSSGTLGVY